MRRLAARAKRVRTRAGIAPSNPPQTAGVAPQGARQCEGPQLQGGLGEASATFSKKGLQSNSVSHATKRHQSLEVIAINAGRKAGDAAKMQSLIDAASTIAPSWAAIYVSELDAYSCAFDVDKWATIEGHQVHRWWPGGGSIAMAWIIHRAWCSRAQSVRWQGRAGAVAFADRAMCDRPAQREE